MSEEKKVRGGRDITVRGWPHHHHSTTGHAPVEHRHSLGVGSDGVTHEHFDYEPRCTDPNCPIEEAV